MSVLLLSSFIIKYYVMGGGGGRVISISFPKKIQFFRDRESDITKERIQKILASGANVILTTGGIDDLCLKYFVEAGAMAVRRCKKADLKRIAKATGKLDYLN